MSQFRSQRTLFAYSGKQKYIKLTQTYPTDPGNVQRAFLLDQYLSIITQQSHQDIVLQKQPNTDYQEEHPSPLFFTIPDIPVPYQLHKYYTQYLQIDDLLIGRQHWGRIQNAIKIESDSISRDHTRISRRPPICSKAILRQTLRKTIETATQHSSKWRRLPQDLVEKIADYAVQIQSYWIQDCFSRNGTYLIEYGEDKHRLIEEGAYQFQSQSYKINVLFKGQSKGTSIGKIIQDYESTFSTLRANYIHHQVVFPPGMSNLSLQTSEAQYDILLIQCYVSHELMFLYWIINGGEDAYYSIGEGQVINVTYTIHSNEIRTHGYLLFQNGAWYIMGLNNENKVWVKLQPNLPYHLSKNRYKVMISHHSVLSIQFHNFN